MTWAKRWQWREKNRQFHVKEEKNNQDSKLYFWTSLVLWFGNSYFIWFQWLLPLLGKKKKLVFLIFSSLKENKGLIHLWHKIWKYIVKDYFHWWIIQSNTYLVVYNDLEKSLVTTWWICKATSFTMSMWI